MRSSLHIQRMQRRRQKQKNLLPNDQINAIGEYKISKIQLHEDLNNFKPKGHDILPETIFQELKQNKIAEHVDFASHTETPNNECSALVLYHPPQSFLSDLNLKSSLAENVIEGDKTICKELGTKNSLYSPSLVTSQCMDEPCEEVEMV